MFLISSHSLDDDHEASQSLKGHPLRSKKPVLEGEAPLEPEDRAHHQSVRQLETTRIHSDVSGLVG